METFQLTASRRGWPYFPFSIFRNRYISTHSLTKRLTVIASPPCNSLIISTHSLTKRLTNWQDGLLMRQIFQLTASRRGWREWSSNFFYGICISTHSLTKRLTRSAFEGIVNFIISTHSLTKRLTKTRLSDEEQAYISTHSLTKRLTCRQCRKAGRCNISTHSLTKRLTFTTSVRT